MPTSISFIDALLAFCGLLLLRKLFEPRASVSLPPGPRGWPLIGNAFDIPSFKPWLTFARWGEEWGDICYLSAMGQSIIIVNSAKVAMDMMDKKGSIYSDRPVFPMGGELVGYKNLLGLSQYGDRFREGRKLFHRSFGTHAAIKQLFPVVETETRKLLRRILAKPESLAAHIRRTGGAISLRVSHGYLPKEEFGSDPFVDRVDIASDYLSLALTPGAFLVDFLPVLRYLPEWFPGAGFKKTAKVWAAAVSEVVELPHAYTKQEMAAGTAEKSFASTLLEERPDEEYMIKWAATSVDLGGSETTVTTNEAFFLAMVLYPDVQAKAQAELDAVVGSDRLPELADRKHLPYVSALCKEVFRWHTVAPTGIPHRTKEDDVHGGYLIPKGSLVIPNIWKMAHDSQVYSNPMTFDPTRFMASEGKEPERDPYDICFGFGRRICPGNICTLHPPSNRADVHLQPGKLLADASVFITAAMTLAVFKINKCIEDGIVVEPAFDQTSGAASHPVPYKCSIVARSAKAAALILSDEA